MQLSTSTLRIRREDKEQTHGHATDEQLYRAMRTIHRPLVRKRRDLTFELDLAQLLAMIDRQYLASRYRKMLPSCGRALAGQKRLLGLMRSLRK